jgi:hypothetical protein
MTPSCLREPDLAHWLAKIAVVAISMLWSVSESL